MSPSTEVSHGISLTSSEQKQNDANLSSDQSKDLIESNPIRAASYEKYPRWIGHKFEPDGRVLPFPGNTTVCHLSPESELYRAMLPLYDSLAIQEFASLYALLPPASWHMTLFEGVTDHNRKRTSWPGELPLDAPLSTCTTHIKAKLTDFKLETEPPFKMKVDGWEPLENGVALKVVPANPAEEQRLRRLRDRLAEHLQMRHPGHEIYSFHVSVAYTLCYLAEQDSRKIREFLESFLPKLPLHFELGAPEFCTFEDMFAFHRDFFL